MSENVVFSAKQIAVIDWLAASKFDRRPTTQEMLADQLGITARTIQRWKKLPGFLDAVTRRARELLGDDLPEIYGALRREAMGGSFQHIKLALELTGEYVERKEVSGEVNIKGYTVVSPDSWDNNDDQD